MISTLDIIIAQGPVTTVNVPYTLDEPIFLLIKRIQEKLGTTFRSFYRKDLFLNGIPLEDHSQSLAHYRIFGNTLTYHAVPPRVRQKGDVTVHVTVLGAGDMRRTLHFSPDTTINQLKASLDFYSDSPTFTRTLMMSNKPLKGGESTLADNGITDDWTIHLNRHRWSEMTPRGALFSNSSNNLDTCAPHPSPGATCIRGCPVAPGANVECACKCTTAAQTIVYKHGLGILELAKTSFLCPQCDKNGNLTPLTVVLLRCKYRFHGIKETGEQFTTDWKHVHPISDYQMLYPNKSTQMRRLVIESAGVDEHDECAICLENLVVRQTLNCGHQFHAECINKWRRFCPSCHYNRHLISGN